MAGDTDIQAFATSFAQLATNSLSQKVPGLIPKMLGFQVIDKTDDDSRAVGFFGFDVAQQLVYVPAFFLRGEIRGTDQMYIKDKDLFLPLDEKWIDYIESKKQIPLGESTEGSNSQLGISAPDLSQSSAFQYNTKMSSLKMPEWAKGAAAMFTRLNVSQEPRYAKVAGLIECLRAARPEAGEHFLKTIKKFPKVAAFVLENYSSDDLIAAISDTSSIKKAALNILNDVKQEVEFVTSKTASMSDEEKEIYLRDGYVVRDARTKTADVIKNEVKIYDSPSEAGFYKVLFKDGGFDDAFVMNVFAVGDGRQRGFYFVHKKGSNFVHRAKAKDIVTVDRANLSRSETAEKFMALGKSPSEVKKNDEVIFIDKHGNCTKPIIVTQVTSDDGKTYIRGRVHDYSYHIRTPQNQLPSTLVDEARRNSYGRPLDGEFGYGSSCMSGGDGDIDYTPANRSGGGYSDSDREIVVTDKNLDGLVNIGPKLMVPIDSARAVVLEHESDSDSYPSPFGDSEGKDGKKKPEPKPKEMLGTLNDVENGLRKQASLDRVKISFDGMEFGISSDKSSYKKMNKLSALKHLMEDFQIHSDEARSILKTATVRGSDSFFVKIAISVGDIANTYYDPASKSLANNPAVQNQTDPNTPAPMEFTGDHDLSKSMPILQNAAQTGQKDVFDAAALGALIDINDPGEEINKYIGDLITSIDKLGRILFMLYWHYDSFEERYEKRELVDLEDKLINVFKNLGELTLDLSKRSVVDNPSISGFSLI